MDAPWWQRGVVYQIYPRSFADSNGDGVGDLEGIRRRVGYLDWLGVDAVWLSPIYRSPMADFGYDIADHCDVDPTFGTLDDLDRLLDELHRRALRLVLDWVPNHTSDRHPWFVESRAARDSPKRGWYIWRDPAGWTADGPLPPNNWRQAFRDAPAWTYDEATAQYYLHLFLPEQPDLNWGNPHVEAAAHDVLRFWLGRGVDGFRADVVHLIGKDPALPDDPPEELGTSRVGRHHDPRTHALLRRVRAVVGGYPGDRMIVGEVNLSDHDKIASYYDRGAGLHLAFDFALLGTDWDAGAWRQVLAAMQRAYDTIDAWPTCVLSNHDVVRHRSRYGGSEARARAAALLLLTLRGTPFLYAGEELGLEDAKVPPERAVDPGGRDGCRAPIPWEGEAPHGWASDCPWLPWPPHGGRRSVERLAADPGSILQLYRLLLARRRASAALQLGRLELVDAPEGVLAFLRERGSERRAVLVNFTDEPVGAALDGEWTVDVTSDRSGEARRYCGRLGPNQALLLR